MASDAAMEQGRITGPVVVLGGDADWPLAAMLRSVGVAVLDAEPPPKHIDVALAARYGFLAASARTGTLGDLRLVSQQVRAALDGQVPPHLVWTDADDLPCDGLRAGVEPGAGTAEEVVANHLAHLAALKASVEMADLVVVPLRAVALVEDAAGTVFPKPPKGIKPPGACKTKAAPAGQKAAKTAGLALLAALRSVRPLCRVRLICLGDEAELAQLRALATSLSQASDGLLYHPLLDEVIARLCGPDRDPRLGALLAWLLPASDVVEALANAGAASDADSGRDSLQDKSERRARKEARARRRAAAGTDARVVCEDELLEAFS